MPKGLKKTYFFNLNIDDFDLDINNHKSNLNKYIDIVKYDIGLLMKYIDEINLCKNDCSIKINLNNIDKILLKYNFKYDNTYLKFIEIINNKINLYEIYNIIYYFKLLIEDYGTLILQYINSNEKIQEYFCYQLYVELRKFRRKNDKNILNLYNDMSTIFQKSNISGIHKYCNIIKIIEIINCLDEYYMKSHKNQKNRIFSIVTI